MPRPDLTKTHELADLLFVPRDKRDPDWARQFYAVIDDAGMTTTSDQILQGPDGFSYFVLNMPAPGREFQPLSLAQVLEFCLENSLGIVVEPQPEPPEWVIPFGQLWSKKEFGRFDLTLDPDPDSKTAAEVRVPEVPSHLTGKQAILVGQPNQYYFPAFARSAVKRFLQSQGFRSPESSYFQTRISRLWRPLCFQFFLRTLRNRSTLEISCSIWPGFFRRTIVCLP